MNRRDALKVGAAGLTAPLLLVTVDKAGGTPVPEPPQDWFAVMRDDNELRGLPQPTIKLARELACRLIRREIDVRARHAPCGLTHTYRVCKLKGDRWVKVDSMWGEKTHVWHAPWLPYGVGYAICRANGTVDEFYAAFEPGNYEY